MSPTRRCPQCAAPLEELNPQEPCPACLLQLGLTAFPPPGASGLDGVASDPTTAENSPDRVLLELATDFPGLEIQRLLGEGGMGSVYLARQTALERLVALKFIRPSLAADAGFAERFSREAKALARLNHPHIVTIHDFGQRDGRCYLIMEYVEGTSLRTLLQSGPLTSEQALAIIPQLCEALQYAHDEGVVHRDIKPENILIDRKGRVKIADFGLAKIARVPGSDPSLTATCQVVGTPKYMAPEQMHGSRDVDHRADIYSLGVVFYEMLTGELPWGRFEPPSHHRPVDPRLDQVVLRALERNPDRRYQQASEVKSDVESIGPRVPIRSPAEATASRMAASVAVEELLRRKDVWGSGATLVLAGGIQIVVTGWSVYSIFGESSRHAGASLTLLAIALIALFVIGGLGLGMIALVAGLTALVTGSARAARWGAIALLFPTTPACIVGLPLGLFILRLLRWDGSHLKKIKSAAPDADHGVVSVATPSTNSIFTRPSRKKTLLIAVPLVALLFVAYPQWRRVANQRLGAAARLGDERSVRTWVGLGAEVNAPANEGSPPLLVAALEGRHEVAEVLIRSGALVDAENQFAETPLMVAALRGHAGIVELLIAAKAQPNRRDQDGRTALMLAAMQGHLPIVERLLAIQATPIIADNQGLTPLMWASLQGHASVVSRLLEHGAELEAVAGDGETALHKAAFRGQVEVVRRLLAEGAQVNRQDREGATPLALAASYGQSEIVELLLARKADPRLATKNGVTPLIVAAARGHEAIVERLLSVSALNQSDASGRSALDVAVEIGHDGILDKLVAAGAPETAPFQFRRGYTLARAGKFAAAVEWLEKARNTAHVKAGAWRFGLDGWVYVVPRPDLSLDLFLADCLWHGGRSEEARQRLLKLGDVPPTAPPSLPLVERRLQTDKLSKVRSYSLARSALAQHAREPERPWMVTIDRDDVTHSDATMRETGIRTEALPDLFP